MPVARSARNRAILSLLVGVVIGCLPARRVTADDIVPVLAAWYRVYGRTAATELKPSRVWCGKSFWTAGAEHCWHHHLVPNGVVVEHAEIRGKILDKNGNQSENEIALEVLLDHTWIPTASDGTVYTVNTLPRINGAVTPFNVIHHGQGATRGSAAGLDSRGRVWGGGSAAVVHVEVNGCGPSRQGLDEDRACRVLPDKIADWVPVSDRPGVLFPFDPRHPPSLGIGRELAIGDYVRIVGTLWEDQPHISTGGGGNGGSKGKDAMNYWDGGATAGRGWIEVHPPDFMARIAPPAGGEQLEVITMCCGTAELSRTIRPSTPRPAPTSTIGFEESVDESFTVPRSVKTKEVTLLSDGILVHVRVEEGWFGWSHGAKFKAMYRVFWK